MTSPLGPVQGTLELVILRTLAAAGELHGFEILEWIRDRTDEELVVEDGALYHALRRMDERGLVESGWGVSEKGRRARYYTLTRAGEKELARESHRWERYVKAIARLAPEDSGR